MNCLFVSKMLRILPLVVARTAYPLPDAIDFEVCSDSLMGKEMRASLPNHKPRKPITGHPKPISTSNFPTSKLPKNLSFLRNKQKSRWLLNSVVKREECDVIPVQSSDYTDQKEGAVVASMVDSDDGDQGESVSQVGGFGESEMRLSFQGAGGFGSSGVGNERDSKEFERLVDRTINATVVHAAGTFAFTKLMTIDQERNERRVCGECGCRGEKGEKGWMKGVVRVRSSPEKIIKKRRVIGPNRIREGGAMIRMKGEVGTRKIVKAFRHMRHVVGDIRILRNMDDDKVDLSAVQSHDVDEVAGEAASYAFFS
ncbi:uncharacterized protein LOC125470957 [Pyrus x bretschneideri]|uniref:uncharacterized protein LOC125470957 n=1 Tax=Pyrus x bretschneideri TaxID=225117 RepID=UPI00202E84DF|nr:uncharacterized protein LOC125470957 [Pyrus x bretschneideri]